ncbi:MAG: homoserine O-acetyltransferase [Duncaniella sp.]|nr:homoserine O-acetyltransferase [Duncaniella sp.]
MINYYHHSEPFSLELGGRLDALRIAYHTYGTLNADKSNVVWVCHALTGNSDVQDRWPHTVEEGKFLDPADNFIICANILGSPYGTTAPLHTNPATGAPYYKDFPPYTIRDIVNAHRVLAEALGIGRIKALVGCSVGGFQAIEWAVMEPDRFERLVLMATDAIATPWTIAIDETMRMSIEADPTFGDPDPQAGRKGLAAARAIGLLSYRGYYGYNLTQKDVEELPEVHRASSYQQYQGEKLCRRFDAYSYYAILKAFDTHDVGRGRGGLDAALKRIKARTLVVGLETDIVFPPREMQELCSKIPGAVYGEIHSPFGHDGFLVEYNQLNNLLLPFIKNQEGVSQ